MPAEYLCCRYLEFFFLVITELFFDLKIIILIIY